MHYDNRAFGIDGKITVVPKQQGVEIGQRRGLSSNDIYKINKMYDCLGAGKLYTLFESLKNHFLLSSFRFNTHVVAGYKGFKKEMCNGSHMSTVNRRKNKL
jgi:hypothetical protein